MDCSANGRMRDAAEIVYPREAPNDTAMAVGTAQLVQPQRGGMSIVRPLIEDSSSVRSGIETGHVAPTGLFLISGRVL